MAVGGGGDDDDGRMGSIVLSCQSPQVIDDDDDDQHGERGKNGPTKRRNDRVAADIIFIRSSPQLRPSR